MRKISQIEKRAIAFGIVLGVLGSVMSLTVVYGNAEEVFYLLPLLIISSLIYSSY